MRGPREIQCGKPCPNMIAASRAHVFSCSLSSPPPFLLFPLPPLHLSRSIPTDPDHKARVRQVLTHPSGPNARAETRQSAQNLKLLPLPVLHAMRSGLTSIISRSSSNTIGAKTLRLSRASSSSSGAR